MNKLPFLANLKFLEKRQEPLDSVSLQIVLIVGAVLIAFLIGSYLFWLFESSPLLAYRTLIVEGFGSLKAIGFTLRRATPLLLVGLGTVVAFRSGFSYLGFEGTLLIGAITAVWFALNCAEGQLFGPLPAVLFFPLALLIPFVAGGLWTAIVGFSKARLGGNAVIVSLMSNYVALFLINFLVSGPMRQPGDQPQTRYIPDYTRLPHIIPSARAHAGILVALGAVLLVYFLLRKTTLGYRLIVTGANPRSAEYSGINVARAVITAAFISGGLAGVAGAIEVLGVQYRVTDGITAGLGFTGIVAALLGRLEPFGVAIAGILYAGMGVGADAMQRRAAVPTAVVYTIQGLVVMILFILDIFRHYRLVLPWQRRVASEEGVTP